MTDSSVGRCSLRGDRNTQRKIVDIKAHMEFK